MSEWKARRFWTRVDTRATDGGHEILLDDRVLRTPGKLPLVLPTAPLAQAIAAEWDAQSQEILPHTMPLTRSANSAIEKVLPQVEGVVEMLAEYGGTDLLCYRAAEPVELGAQRQRADDKQTCKRNPAEHTQKNHSMPSSFFWPASQSSYSLISAGSFGRG